MGRVRGFRDKRLGAYVQRLAEQGWMVEVLGDSHVRVTSPDGRRAKVSTTQFEGPATWQAISRLRRIGGP